MLQKIKNLENFKENKKMKKVTNLFAWITLAVVLMVGTTVTKADGIIVHGIVDNQQCTNATGIIISDFTGIIIVGAPQFTGILISDIACQNATGILISD